MSIHESKSITASNDYEFTISEANGNWQDNKEITANQESVLY